MLNGQQAGLQNDHLGDRQDKRFIAIVSAVRLTREGIALLLEQEDGLAVTASVASVRDAVAPSDRHIDVFLVDGLTVAPDDVRISPVSGRLAVFGLSGDRGAILSWVAAGAAVLLPSNANNRDLVAALYAAARGDVACPPAFADIVIRDAPRLAGSRSGVTTAARLSPRERQVLSLIGRGLSNKEIARDLAIELSTVKNHVHSILKRLRAHGRRDAARMEGSGNL